MDIIKAIVMGIIEGITEWLPISSTGHLILADEFIKMKQSQAFMNMFDVVIQLGAILAVVWLYFHKLNPFSNTKSLEEKQDTWQLWFKVVIACLPAMVIGLPLNDFLDKHLHNFITVSLMLIIYGVAFILIEKWQKDKRPRLSDLRGMTYRAAIVIGFFQVLALIPGTSRSGATILGAIIIGCSRFVATEFSFFLSIPVMFGASGVKILKFLANGNMFTGMQFLVLLVGCLTAFIVSIFAIKFLMNYLKRNDFQLFGWYRIVLGVILIVYAVMH
ncbi:MAG: undecaprenyl-diphosphate phosphatase [Streptococcaceae bacterium]|jgi:undecaprenyl-diphosphatase|nr:undecaprenyl-diphosphate phosphatase [Streptococcaceae bacterium]